MKPRNRAYIAHISDINNKPVNTDSGTYIVKEPTNHRHKVFCKCRFDFEIQDLKIKLVQKKYDPQIHGEVKEHELIKYGNSKFVRIPTFENGILCSNCGEKYEDFSDIRKLDSFLRNIVATGVKVFEKNKHPDLIKLSFFQKNLGVSKTTKRMFTKFLRTNFIFNKKTKMFFIIKNKQLNKIGLSILDHQITSLFNLSSERIGILFKKEEGIEKFHSEIKKFIFEISKFIDKRDVDKINSILDSQLILKNKTNASESSNYYKNLLVIYISLIYYPPFFTLLLTKGVDVYLDFIAISGKPTLTKFKRTKPTNPYEIIERSIKHIANEVKKTSADAIVIETTKERIKSFHIGKQLFKKIESNRNSSVNSNKKIKLDFELLSNVVFLKNIEYKDLNSILLELNENEVQAFYSIIYYYKDCDLRHLKHILNLSNSVLIKKEKDSPLKFNWLINNNPHQNNNIQGQDDKYQYHNFDLNIYKDIFRMYNILEIDINQIFQYKTWKEIVDIHDELSARMKNIKLEGFSKQMEMFIRLYSSLDTVIDSVKFETIKTAIGLEKEGQEMHHCVGGYVSSVANGECVIVKVLDEISDDKATMELRILKKEGESDFKYSFNQLKSKHNQRATEKIINATLKYLTSLKAEKGNSYDLLVESKNQVIIPDFDGDNILDDIEIF